MLTRGALDDGRGKVSAVEFKALILVSNLSFQARVALFRHKHEVETGRTSSVGMEVSPAAGHQDFHPEAPSRSSGFLRQVKPSCRPGTRPVSTCSI